MSSTYRHRVRYHETDAQGILFNSRYLELADVAMTEFIRALGWSYAEFVGAGADPSVVRAEVDFRRAVRFDDELEITTSCTHVGSSSFRLRTVMCRDGDEVAVTNLVYVNIDPHSGGSVVLPDAVASRLREVMVPSDPGDSAG